MTKVKNFEGFMKSRRLNESDMSGFGSGMEMGANPEDGMDAEMGEEGLEGDLEDGEEEKELTLEDAFARIEDLEKKVEKLLGEDDEESDEDADAEGEESEEDADGEEAAA